MNDRTVVTALSPSGIGPGTQLNDLYEIDELLAAGGMGKVFRGHAIETGDPVAIKTIRPDFAGNAQALALFRKEAAALRDVHHGAVVRYYVFSVDRRLELPYLAMEFVTGQSLAERLRTGPLSIEEVDILRRRLAGGLQAAHEAGIVHRDVSPDNVILPGGDPARAKIIDFGIARTTTGQTVIGSGFAGKYDYVSPEQLGLQGGEVTGRSDIYSLGLVLAQASRGRPVDMGDNPAEFITRRSALPDLTGIDARLRPLLEAMLQPDPRRRPASMAEIEAWQPARREPPPAARSRKSRPLILVGGAAGLAVAAGLAAFWLQPTQDTPAPPAAPLAEAPLSENPLSEKPPAEPPRTQTLAPRPPEPGERLPADPTPPEASPGKLGNGSSGSDAGKGEGDTGIGKVEAVPGAKPESRPPTVSGDRARPDGPDDASPRDRPSESRPADEPAPTAPPTQAERIAAYIRDYRGGPCFFLSPTTVGAGETAVEGFGIDPEPFRGFDTSFKTVFGFEAEIQLRQIENGQCPVVELLAAQARARPSAAPALRVEDDRIRRGEELRGSVETGNARALRLLLVDGNGTVHDLNAFVRRTENRAQFAIRIDRPAPGAWRPQLLVAIAGEAIPGPMPAAGQGAEAIFSALARSMGSAAGSPGIAVRYLKVGG